MSPKDRDETLEYMYQVSPWEIRSSCGSTARTYQPYTDCAPLNAFPQFVVSSYLHTHSCCTDPTGWRNFRLPSVSSIAIWREMQRRDTNCEVSHWVVFWWPRRSLETSYQCKKWLRLDVCTTEKWRWWLQKKHPPSCVTLAGNLNVTFSGFPSCTGIREEGWGGSGMGWHRRDSTRTYQWTKASPVHTSRMAATSAVVGWASFKLLYLW